MRPLPPLFVLDELREVNEGLVDLMAAMTPSDWTRRTVHRDRDVKDLVAHLLDGSLKRLSSQRDGWAGVRFEGSTYAELVAFVQERNREWIVAARRLSPTMLARMVAEADAALLEVFAALDPHAEAPFPVAWAGDARSPNWFDVAREYTEKWHHQAQIREAIGKPGLDSRRYLHPVLSTFVRGLPHAYRSVEAPEDTRVQLTITGEATSVWCLTRAEGAWALEAKVVGDPACEVVLDEGVAWRLWTKGLASDDTRSRIAVHGDAELAAPMLAMCCILA